MIDVNLGQSQFQDTYFVYGAQLTPYRRLRQIELELRSLEDSIKKTEFATRRLSLKLKNLTDSEEDNITRDETLWDLQQQTQLLQNSLNRRQNFLNLKTSLIESVPAHYWDAGFEAAEAEHWKLYFAKQISTAVSLGLPAPLNIIDSVLLLPDNLREDTIKLAMEQTKQLQLQYGPPQIQNT